MKKADLERFSTMLTAERDRVADSLAKRSRTIKKDDDGSGGDGGKAHSSHMADQGSDEYENEATIKFASTEGRYLYRIEGAIGRIEQGTYGDCLGCGGAIALERLEALPYARYCIECKEKEEAGLL